MATDLKPVNNAIMAQWLHDLADEIGKGKKPVTELHFRYSETPKGWTGVYTPTQRELSVWSHPNG